MTESPRPSGGIEPYSTANRCAWQKSTDEFTCISSAVNRPRTALRLDRDAAVVPLLRVSGCEADPMTLFPTPAPWGLGPGPSYLRSIDQALAAVEMWLAVIPDMPLYREQRARMLALQDILVQASRNPGKADLQSAQLAIAGMVGFVRATECDVLAEMRAALIEMRRNSDTSH
jgi:hypothetical protein